MNARNTSPSLSKGMQPGSPRAVAFFTLFALLLHLPLYFIPESWLFSKSKLQKRKRRVVYVSRMTRQGPRRYQKMKRKLRKNSRRMAQRKQEKKKKKKPKKPKGQIVDLAPTPNDKPPERARFLSEYNTNVKKQSISKFRKLKYKMAMNKPTRLKKYKPSKKRANKRRKVAMRVPQRMRIQDRPKKAPKPRKRPPTKRALAIPKVKRQRRAAMPKSKKGTRRSLPDRPSIQGRGRKLSLNLGPPLKIDPSLKPIPNQNDTGKGTHSNPSPGTINLRPDFGTLSRIEGNPAPDHVTGVKEGDQTLLNSRRYVYASFFNRVKQQVAQHWNPNLVYRRRDPYGNVYGVKDRHTTLKVILTKGGKLRKVFVVNSSGLKFLDREAMRAFRQAQPFPNPPEGLIDKDGNIQFKFGFFLQISSPPKMLFFR